ncbi:hypothetical protein BpHYR1_030439, partial [Brachionus plicatilis]
MFKVILVIFSIALLNVNAQTCTFESNVDYFGNDLGTGPCIVKTLDDCCALCYRVAQCAAWTFLPSTGACWLKYTVTERRVMSDGRFSGCRQQPTLAPTQASTQAPTPAPCPCTEKTDINYPGCDLKEVADVASSADCCSLCRQTTGCAAYAYYKEFKYCYLKSAKENGTPETYSGM